MDAAEFDLIRVLLTGAGGAGAAVVTAILLLRKILKGLSEHIDRTEREVTECKRNCETRMEKNAMEYRQIICALNEIKVQVARTETLAVLQSTFQFPDQK